VVDILREEGASLRHTIMGHMSLRPFDLDFQQEIASLGVYLGYDTISTDFNWGHRGSGLCDHEIADNIRVLIANGFLEHVVLSMDIHMKIMMTAYGGGGYAYLLREFLPRLREREITEQQIQTMLVDNPRRVFSAGT
jgi:phosphotriesterase-related protein